jgi:hypothetical protein
LAAVNTGTTSTDDFLLPLAIALILAALAIFGVIGVATGFIPTVRRGKGI